MNNMFDRSAICLLGMFVSLVIMYEVQSLEVSILFTPILIWSAIGLYKYFTVREDSRSNPLFSDDEVINGSVWVARLGMKFLVYNTPVNAEFLTALTKAFDEELKLLSQIEASDDKEFKLKSILEVNRGIMNKQHLLDCRSKEELYLATEVQ